MGDIVVITKPTRTALTERQLVDYESFKEQFIQWLLSLGKTPQKATRYAEETTTISDEKWYES